MQHKRPANFLYLLIGLLSILVASPLAYELTNRSIGFITQLALTTTLIISIWSLIDARRWFIAGISLVVLDIIATAIVFSTQSTLVASASLLIEITFCSMTFVFTLQNILVGSKIDLNRIIGAICAYLLLGVTLALLNMLLTLFIPDSFHGLSDRTDGAHGMDVVYYTFVTMSTLGFGDITPVTPLARALAYLTAIGGQFYIAILIGMLVGQYLSQNQASRSKV